MKDYYQILEIPKTADAVAIKKAYHRLAKLYHPDVNKGNIFFENKFKEINEAYAVLSDFKQKWYYDLELNNPIIISHSVPQQEKRKTYYPRGYTKERAAQIDWETTKRAALYIVLIMSFIIFLSVAVLKLNHKDDINRINFDSLIEDSAFIKSNVKTDTEQHLSKEEYYKMLAIEYNDSGDSTLWKANEDSLYHVLDSMVNSH